MRLILPKAAWEDFEKQEFYNQLMEWLNCLKKGCKYESEEVRKKSVKTYFLCNGKMPECKYAEGCFQNGGGCKRTSHIDYARNFEKHAERLLQRKGKWKDLERRNRGEIPGNVYGRLKRKQRQSVPHTIVTGGERMDMEKIINVLIKLIEEQEGVNISYTLEKKESA